MGSSPSTGGTNSPLRLLLSLAFSLPLSSLLQSVLIKSYQTLVLPKSFIPQAFALPMTCDLSIVLCTCQIVEHVKSFINLSYA